VRLTVLGSDGTWPGEAGQCSGYLLTHEGFHLWLDAGTGTFARLQEHVGIDDVGAMLVTHGHADHFLDMIPAFYARHYGGLGTAGLPFYSPEGFFDVASKLVSENGRDVMAEAYSFGQLAHGTKVEIGPFRVTAFEMTHIGVYSLGYRIEAGGHVLAFSGDTGPCENAVEMARGADLFLCEATYQDPSELTFFHLSATQAAEHATAAEVKRLVLTHLTPGLDHGTSLEQAANGFAGAIDVAVPEVVWEVGA
jgi:ribonuclease BN (tRNA processing enzyme)